MKKIAYVAIVTATALLAFLMQVDWNLRQFTDTLNVDPQAITELKLSLPAESIYKTTEDPDKIKAFVDYMNLLSYEKIRGDEPSELPMSASMVYLYDEHDKMDFIVIFDEKILISHKFYNMVEKPFEQAFLEDYYNGIE